MSELGDIKRKVAEYEAKGNLKKAVEELEKAVETFSREGSLFNKLGDLYIKLNRKDDALTIYEKGAKVFKEETYYPNAIALCKKILRLDDSRTEVYGLLGELHRELDQRGEAANYLLEYADRKMKENDLETALNTYNTIKELVPNNPKILKTISAIYEKVGKKENGEVLLKEAAKIETEQEKIKESVLEKKAELSEEKTAVEVEEEKPVTEEVEEAKEAPEVEEKPPSEIEKEEAKIEEEIGLEELVSPEVAELLKEEEPEAKVEEPKVEEEETQAPIETETPPVLTEVDKTAELGELYLNLGSEEEAIDCFRSAAQEAQRHKDYQRALELNRKIADLRPFDLKSRQHIVEIANAMKDDKLKIASLLDLAESLTRRDAKTEAQRLYEEVLKIDPENPIAKEMLTTIEKSREFVDLGAVLKSEIEGEKKTPGLQSIEELVSEFRREVFESIGEGDYRSHYDLGVAYKGMGLYQEAIEEFEIAAKDEEIRLKAYEMIGSCMLERNKIDDAIRILNEGLKINGHPKAEYFGLYFLLGNCYEKKQDFKNALRAYVNAYNIDKSVAELTKKITTLKEKVTELLKKKQVSAAPPKSRVQAKKSKITYL